jgi:outer membrane cobalamin receptor
MLFALPPSEPPTDAIVVTGKALPDPAAEKVYQVQVIDSRRLTDSPAHELDEILKQVSGLQLFRRMLQNGLS